MWTIAIGGFVGSALASVVAMGGGGRLIYVAGLLAFIFSVPFYWAFVRLGDHYEGQAQHPNRLIRAIGIAALAAGVGWFALALSSDGFARAQTAKGLAFFCFFLNGWEMAMVVLERDRHRPEKK